ncbi:uncharacterized protein BCR38DRAFT_351788 [Pseudomassariella vexata]|uniref:DUF7582 domain-containing protein n=1 Tax=Pseudomassariella vexata TaxID=1141098 RepID=A0A1Y2DJZ8_9PEZI|nr:uncharacterized protein BCR38DRAFT_351788 [Pseudomassariella vexata]ORY59105.1 hypothetical protein BCR38DRAFT_351788 [Pseudomassariella vexata]
MSSLLKQRISSPLEAGTSILDSQNLPSHLTQALEYASKRLTRRALHITLVIVRKEYQLPSSTPPCATPTSVASTPASPEFSMGAISPSRFASPVVGFRSLIRRGTNSSMASMASMASISTTASDSSYCRSAAVSPTFTDSFASPAPMTPMTPCTPASVATISTVSSTASNASAGGPSPFGIRLIYTTPLSAKDEKILRSTIMKAERKFRIGTGWLPPAATASACGLNADLVRRSILQNEVLFSSEGLTLLGLDRLYTFKSALAAYARTTLPPSSLSSPISDSTRIEDAVDELRRLVLANGGRQVAKSDLHRSYEWIGVSASALGDVERMYRRAYGGLDRSGAFELTPEEREREREVRMVVKIGTPPPARTPVARTPVLKLQTSFSHNTESVLPAVMRPVPEDGDVTARPIPGQPFWNGLGASIDEMMLQDEGLLAPGSNRASRLTIQRLGPMTPNGYDDISPVTRGEWGFLFSGDSWKGGKTAVVETC